mmetsp:Transcript_33805/g.49502  ORF Transcript_33805/g.49502 Transcript_33805/m.49502 type:complete len:170 (-) Transcript_33805:124-633(-)
MSCRPLWQLVLRKNVSWCCTKVSCRANSFELPSVYVVGGHTGAAHQCSVEVWNAHTRGSTPATAQWKPVSSLEQPRSSHAAVCVGKALVALGGHCGRGGSRLTSCEMWQPLGSEPQKTRSSEPQKSQWRFINGMGCPRSDFTAAAAPAPCATAPPSPPKSPGAPARSLA